MKNAEVAYIGIGVSKEAPDIDAKGLGVTRIANAPEEIRKAPKGFARKAKGAALQSCLESAGPHARGLVAECHTVGLAHSVPGPHKVARLAKAIATAKTGRIDAAPVRHDPVMRRLHERERAKGKPYKVAITAAMRRLLCHLESVARDYRAKRKNIPA